MIPKILRPISLLPALCLCLPAVAGTNFWTVTGAPGAQPSAFAVAPSNPDVIYTGTTAGLHRSDDGGLSWSLLYSEFSNGPGRSFFFDPVDPDTLYVAHRQSGFFVSTDAGITFTERNGGLPNGASSTTPSLPVAVMAANGAIYVDTDGSGIWITSDKGLTWTPANIGLPAGQFSSFAPISDLAVDANDPGHLIVYTADTEEIYVTRNGGLSWTAALSSPTSDSYSRNLKIDPFDGNHALIVILPDIFETTDGGDNWTALGHTMSFPRYLEFDAGTADRIFASTANGIYRSDNRGATWNFESSLDARHWAGGVGSLQAPPGGGGWMLAGDRTGVYRRAVDGPDWNLSRDGLLGRCPDFLAPASTRPNVVYASNDYDVFASEDAGSTWSLKSGSPSLGEIPVSHIVIDGVVDPDNGYRIYISTVYGTLMFSDDGGGSWTTRSTVPGSNTYISSLAIIPGNPPSFIGALVSGGVVRSDDGGFSWQTLPSPSPATIYAIAVKPDETDVILAGDLQNGVFRSADGGANWTLATDGFSDPIGFIAFDPHAPDTVYAGSNINGGGALFSLDAGQTWQEWTTLPFGVFDQPTGIAFDPQIPGIHYVASGPNGVARSIDNGTNWEPINDRDLARLGGRAWGPLSIHVDPHTPYRLYAGTDAGVAVFEFARDLSLSLSTESSTINLSDTISYSATVTNNGPGTAALVELDLSLPPNAGFVDVAAGAGSCAVAGQQTNCELQSLSVGESWLVEITLRVTAFGQLELDGATTSLERELDDADNNGADTTATVIAVDLDSDGVADNVDNCIFVANTDQRDTNGDGYGNVCDADLDNNNLVNFVDLTIIRTAFFSSPGAANWNPHADLDGDNVVNFADLVLMARQFFGPPGPSGPLL